MHGKTVEKQFSTLHTMYTMCGGVQWRQKAKHKTCHPLIRFSSCHIFVRFTFSSEIFSATPTSTSSSSSSHFYYFSLFVIPTERICTSAPSAFLRYFLDFRWFSCSSAVLFVFGIWSSCVFAVETVTIHSSARAKMEKAAKKKHIWNAIESGKEAEKSKKNLFMGTGATLSQFFYTYSLRSLVCIIFARCEPSRSNNYIRMRLTFPRVLHGNANEFTYTIVSSWKMYTASMVGLLAHVGGRGAANAQSTANNPPYTVHTQSNSIQEPYKFWGPSEWKFGAHLLK